MSAAPLKVLQIFRILDRVVIGGLYTYLESLCRSLAGTPVTVAATAIMFGAKPQFVAEAPYLGERRHTRIGGALRFRKWLRQAVAGYDVVHIHGIYWAMVLAAPVCRACGVPYVVSPHGSLLQRRNRRTSPWWLFYLKVMGRDLLRQSAGIICTTETDAKVARAFDPSMKVHIVPPAVEISTLPPVQHRAPRPGEPELRVAFVGRLQPVKELPGVFAAIALLRAEGVDAALDVIGDGSPVYLAKLKARAEELGIAASVHFHGYRQGAEKSELLRRAHVFVLNSDGENFSFATAEAMSEGLPVALSDSVGLAQTVLARDCGRVYPFGDVPALAAALKTYRDPQLRGEHGGRAHACAQAEFSAEAMGRALVSLYGNAAASRSSAR